MLGVVMLADGFGCAELDCGLTPRLGEGHSRAHILLDLEGKMFGHLISQALVGTPPGREIRQPYEETSQKFHAKSSPLTLKKRAMMAAVCSQSRVSVCSCLRPAAVRP